MAQIEFLEWTESDHLRHSKFVGLRDDKDPRRVVKELRGEGCVDERRPELSVLQSIMRVRDIVVEIMRP